MFATVGLRRCVLDGVVDVDIDVGRVQVLPVEGQEE